LHVAAAPIRSNAGMVTASAAKRVAYHARINATRSRTGRACSGNREPTPAAPFIGIVPPALAELATNRYKGGIEFSAE